MTPQQRIAAVLTGRRGGGGSATAPLGAIDDIGGTAPEAAYGMVRLRSAYVGPAIRVRRASDNTETDIGFVSGSSAFDAATLDAFISGTAGYVTTWYDQSGNGRNATQATTANQPGVSFRTIGGVRCVSFSNTPALRRLVIPTSVSVSRRAFTFGHVTSLAGNRLQSNPVQLGSSTNQYSIFVQTVAPARWNGNPQFVTTISPQCSASVFTVRASASATNISENEISQNGSAPTLVTMAGGFIGDTALAGGYQTRGDMGALLIYGRTMTDPELAQMKTSLQSAFSIAATETGRFIVDGDSIAIGSANEYYDSFARLVAPLLPSGTRYYNVGGGGRTLINCNTDYAGSVAPLVTAGTVVWQNAATNDIGLTTDSAATIYGRIQTYCGSVRASGGLVIVSTVLPRTGLDATKTTTRTDYNDLVRTNWASFADGFVDFANDPVMGAVGAQNNSALYPDGLHPNYAGNLALVPSVEAAIEALL